MRGSAMTELDLLQAATAEAVCRRCGDECGADDWAAEVTRRSDLLWLEQRTNREDGHA